MDVFSLIAERKITEAVEEGKFNNFEGKGKPFDYQKDHDIPIAFRAMYRMLKAGKMAPSELILMKEVAKKRADLKLLIAQNPNSEEVAQAKRKLAEMEISLKLKMDDLRKAFGRGY